jgi:L-lactate dehydrogenase
MSRVAIVGGAGRVGVSFAFSLLSENICKEIVLVDVAEDVVQGERLDLMHASSTLGDTRFIAGSDPELLAGAQVIVVPAGARRKADQSRLDLIRTNVGIVDQWMEKIQKVNPSALVLIVVNPVDVLTYRAYCIGGKDRKRIFGLGNVMDVVRIRSILAEHLNWNAQFVGAHLLGEHGDAMVPIWSQVSYAGFRLRDMPGIDPEVLKQVYVETRSAGADVIRMKGGAGWAVGVAITEVVRSILKDEKRVLCVSSVPNGEYGIEGNVALSLPAIIGLNGVEGYVDVKLDGAELEGLQKAANVLRETYSQVA